MKIVQIGILVALVVVAGLLYNVYRGQSVQPAPATAAQTQPQAVPAAVPVQAPAETPKAEAPPAEVTPPPAEEPAKAKPAVHRAPAHKPSPAAPARHEPDPPAQPVQSAPAIPATPAPSPAVEPAAPNPPVHAEMPPPPPREPQKVTIPAGTTLSVRLGETLTTEHNQPGDTFSGTLDQALVIDGMAIAERGARVEGRIAEAERAGRVKGLSSIALQLVKLHTSDGQNVAIKTESFRKEGVASRGDDAKKVGVGAALGAAIGAIAGGGKGAAIGAGVGGAAGTGTVMATRGKDVVLPVETRMTFRLQEPLTLTEKLN